MRIPSALLKDLQLLALHESQ